MPAGKRQQTNTVLYALITVVTLFIISAVLAVIFYLKFEDQRTTANQAKQDLEQMVSQAEQRKIPTIIGTIPRGKSGLGTMLDYLDTCITLIIGPPVEETSAEVKVDTARRKTKDVLQLVTQKYPDVSVQDANSIGLVRVVEQLKLKLDNTSNTAAKLNEQLNLLQSRFDDAMAASFQKEQTLLAEKEKLKQEVDKALKDYNDLKKLLEQTSEQRVQTLMADLSKLKAKNEDLNKQLLRSQAELKMAQDKIKSVQQELQRIVPQPEQAVMAFQPDAKIMLVDDQNKVVHINIGSDDGVYRGLTFSVYDRNMPIPEDGKGKAEIKVFDPGKNISLAKITASYSKMPIMIGDNVANLIWDSKQKNVFVVAGDFDLDGDGIVDRDAADKITALIKNWGGTVADNVSVETDFIVLGTQPPTPREPSFQQREIDPLAMEKYKAELKKLDHYHQVRQKAAILSVPVFNFERFLYLIGYKSQVNSPGAF